jgi:RNA polymerase sigma-70 factor (ECF subfamily)
MFLAAYGPPPDSAYDHAGDATLVSRMRAGVEADARAAFEELFTRFGAPLIAFAHAQLGARDSAEDIVQDIFVALWTNRATWTVRGSLRTYLYQSVRHRVVNARRDASVRGEIGLSAEHELQWSVPAFTGADARVTDWELRQILDQAVMRLPPRNREVFILVRAQHLSHAEAAEVLGISVNAVAVHMRRALDVLRRVLAEYQR